MLSRCVALLCLVGVPFASVRPSTVATPSPITVAGGRSVELRDDRGTITRVTTIPERSQFATYGGTRRPCTFTASTSGMTSDGQHYDAGRVVTSQRWLFVEGEVLSFGEPTPSASSRGPLAAAVRHFVVFCDSTAEAIGVVDVPVTDVVLNPRWAVGQMVDQLHLVSPTMFTNPVASATGGYITRYPIWLAIQTRGWAWQRSSDARWRGWTLWLSAQPVAVAFNVKFTPSADRGSTPFMGMARCVAVGATPLVDAVSVPAMPPLPEVALPGVNGPCRYTPPGPGSLTLQAIVTFHVTFWANGYLEAAPDYVLRGPIATYRVGELSSVNKGA